MATGGNNYYDIHIHKAPDNKQRFHNKWINKAGARGSKDEKFTTTLYSPKGFRATK